jgi:hypothetical protein
MRCTFSMVGVALAGSALAGPTMLITIPIADILGNREFAYTYGISGTESKIDSRWYHAQGMAVGFFDRFEFGLDEDFAGSTSLHFRLKLIEDPKDAKWAFSVGFNGWNMDDETAATSHICGRYDFSGFRLHGGFTKSFDGTRPFIGLDGPIFGDWTWMLEHTGGPGSMTWGGLNVPVKGVNGLSVMGAVGLPERRSDGLQFSLSATWGVKL